MNLKHLSLGLVLSASLITGCGLQGGTTVIKHESGTPVTTTETSQPGTYALYDSYDSTPQTTIRLEMGETIGFREDETGKVVAVAGSKTFPVSAGNKTYYWKRKS